MPPALQLHSLAYIQERMAASHLKLMLKQDTVRVEIDLADSGLSYEPGDALGIYAQNSTEVHHVAGLHAHCPLCAA